MKLVRFLLLTLIIIISCFTLGCPEAGGPGSDPGVTFGTKGWGGGVSAITPGYLETVTIDTINVKMAYAPGGLTFPTGQTDGGIASVDNGYWIADSEVTYELWQKVYVWATSGTGDFPGEGSYTIANPGKMGGGYGTAVPRTVYHPVTSISFNDMVVWCNAFTEWFNAKNNTNLQCVYSYSGEILRDSTNSNGCGNAVANPYAFGFRLLTHEELEQAARYKDGISWTYGDHASGDETGACFESAYGILEGLGLSTVFGDYSVHKGNSNDCTAAVKTKLPNALGLYDMSGNVEEWCFDWHPSKIGSERVIKGGQWLNNAIFLQVGYQYCNMPHIVLFYIGFRVVRNG